MSAPPPFRITERDVAMLQAIARFRFLQSNQVRRIVGGSERGVQNRLRLLAAHAYLVRLSSAVTEPFAFGLTNKAARLLADHAPYINPRLDWRAKNDTTRYFLTHTLAVAETMLHFDCAAHDGVFRLVDQHDLLPDLPERTRGAHDPFCLRVTIRHRDQALTIPVVPDRLFALAYPDNTIHHFALELDRGTMDIWANRLVGKTSVRRKLIGYFHSRAQKRFAETWGFKSFRVLTVTTSDSRIDSMLQAQRRVAPQCPPGLFLYSTADRIAQHGALGPAWVTSKSDSVSLRHDKDVRAGHLETPMSGDDTAPSLRAAGVKPGSKDAIRARA